MQYKIIKKLVIQKLDKEMFAFDSDNSIIYSFNETAYFIFSKIKLKQNFEAIILSLTNKYDVEKEKAIKDAKEIIKDMLKKKIIEST